MTAVVQIREWNGTTGSPTQTDKTSGTIRYRQSNAATVDASNPLSKPTAGSTWSFDKWMQLFISTTGPTGSITNLQFYTDGTNSYGTGITAWVKTTNIASGSFVTPTNPGTDSGYSDQFGFNSGAAKNMDAVTAGAPYTGTSTNIGDFAVLHMTLATTVSAPQNPTSSETLTWSYDET
jgi:hypothetical protein